MGEQILTKLPTSAISNNSSKSSVKTLINSYGVVDNSSEINFQIVDEIIKSDMHALLVKHYNDIGRAKLLSVNNTQKTVQHASINNHLSNDRQRIYLDTNVDNTDDLTKTLVRFVSRDRTQNEHVKIESSSKKILSYSCSYDKEKKNCDTDNIRTDHVRNMLLPNKRTKNVRHTQQKLVKICYLLNFFFS